MRAEVKRFHSPDVFDLASYRPPDPANFGFLLQVMVGPTGAEGEESVDLVVCTQAWLEGHPQDQASSEKGLLVIDQYDFVTISAKLREQVSHCEGHDWNEVGACLSKIGYWEFENYRPSWR
jgi:Immunity protein 8